MSGWRAAVLWLIAGMAASAACFLIGQREADPTVAALWGAIVGGLSYITASWIEDR